MSSTSLKVGRYQFDINKKDVVLFNGVCWLFLTRNVLRGYHSYHVSVSKKLCEKFVKMGILVLYEKRDEYVTESGKQMGLYYYKFDIDKLKDYLQSEVR